MNTSRHSQANDNAPRGDATRRPWSQCEVFCIHSYAGESGPPCGWHGMMSETLRGESGGERRCPRCGRATLMKIPSVK